MYPNPSQSTVFNYTKQVVYKYPHKVILVSGRQGIGKTTIYLNNILPIWGIQSLYLDLKNQKFQSLSNNIKVLFLDNFNYYQNYYDLLKNLTSLLSKEIWLIVTTDDRFEGISILNDCSIQPDTYPIVDLTPIPFIIYLANVVFNKPITTDFFVLSSHSLLKKYLHWLNEEFQLYLPYHELIELHLSVLWEHVEIVSPGVFEVYNKAGDKEKIILTNWKLYPLMQRVKDLEESYIGVPVNNAVKYLNNVYINDKFLLALECEERNKILNEIQRKDILLPKQIYKDWIEVRRY